MNRNMEVLTNGFIKENPVLRLVLGTCPALAVTTMAMNGLGMGVAATFVLICSNIVISLLRNIIPGQVRIPAYITIIAGFVTIVQMLVKAYLPDLDQALGVFLPLIVVNCVILGRAEMFASKNGPFLAALDGIGMGIGFTLTLTIMAIIREVFGAGTIFGIQVLPDGAAFTIIASPPGGFLVFGLMMAATTALSTPKKKKETPVEAVEGGEA